MKDFWDKRYGEKESAYGKEPNIFFKQELLKYTPGRILLPAEGEGRNAIFAAKTGWEVSAFDMSKEGKSKADKIAKENKVEIDYQVGDLNQMEYEENYFDLIGLIYAHFPFESKSRYHKLLDKYLRKGGTVIFEAFSKSHLKLSAINPNAGGPKDKNMLFSTEELRSDFKNFDIIQLEETEVFLNEGLYHNGKSSVIRFVGKKR
jgi:SAM-dependent methyltransferase